MNHADHVRLLRGGIEARGGIWADLGSGTGAFTLALADLLGVEGVIYSVDRDAAALREQARRLKGSFPAVTVHTVQADFTLPLDLPELDGMVMANALHFVPPKGQTQVIQQVKGYLRPGGRLIVVEYNVDQGNRWVPYPISYPRWQGIARSAGFEHVQLLAKASSHFLKEFYSALSW